MGRQERMRKCQECGRKNISPYLKVKVCGDCRGRKIREEICGKQAE